jgi:hypothetical protein
LKSYTVRTKNGKQDNLAALLNHERLRQSGFGVALGNSATVEDGPLEPINGREAAKAVRKREVRAQYINNLQLDAPLFGANEINDRLMSFQSYKKLVAWSRRQYWDKWL